MKVALLLYGQPRSIDNLKVYNSHKLHILDKYDTDVFCHTWYKPDTILPVSSWSKLNNVVCPNNSIDIIKEYYKPKVLHYEEPKYFYNSKISNSKEITVFNYANDSNISNIISQLYSIDNVSKLFIQYSNTTGTVYDFVIVARYDIIIHEFPNLTTLDRNFFIQ